jgi:predicted ATPase/DNA-binding SARP family transcriptional activator
MAQGLCMSLLGDVHIARDDVPVTGFVSGKALALLCYLAVAGRAHFRPALAGLLWGDMPEADALMNLRQALTNLRRLVGPHLNITRQQVAFNHDSPYWLDVERFEARLAGGTPDAGIEPLQEAVELYRGDFMAGFYVRDAPAFEEWMLAQAARLRTSALGGLHKLALMYARQGDYEQGIATTRRLLELEPWHEEAHRQLMLLLARAGRRGAALAQYQTCHQVLAEELGVEPAAETTALYDRIQAAEAAGRPNLPPQPTSFVGRQAEVAEIQYLLLDEPDCRLLNLVGPGGIGKTRLALAAATQAFDTFPQDTYFVSLMPVGEVEFIVPAMAEALHFTFYGQADPKDQLLDYLRHKTLLLVVDNFEHLRAGAGLLSDILRQAPQVTVLATSRERLNLQEEWVYEVQGLPFPADDVKTSEVLPTLGGKPGEDSEVLTPYSAIELFLQRAHQAQVSFAPSAAEAADMVRICQLVEGMPLGLELAAPWIRSLSCREIADEIERSLDFLTSRLQNVLERHRSLRVVFEQTWKRLSAAERAVLSRLSVFRGGCTRQAAEQVAGATLPVLSSLVDKALLRHTNTGRYELHELIRQFAEAQLQTDPEAVQQAQRRHRDYFIAFLEARTGGVKERRQFETLAEITADIDNVRLAWRGAVANRESEAIERSAECLFIYHLYRNGYDEGLLEFGRAVSTFAALPDAHAGDVWPKELFIPDEKKNLLGLLLAGYGYFLAHRRDLQKGQILLEQTLSLLRGKAPGDRRQEAFALLWLGWAHYFQGQIIEGQRCARESLIHLTEIADHWGEGWALLLLGCCVREGRPAEAAEVFRTGLTLCQKSGDQIVLSYLSYNMGAVNRELGRYAQAQQHIDLAVTISEKLNNFIGLGYTLFGRGRLEIDQGKYRQAINTLQLALTYFNKVGTVHASRALIWLGQAHHLQGDYDLAAQLYGQGLEALKAADSKLSLTHCLNYLGCLWLDQGKLHQAEQFQRESLALLQEIGQEPAIIAATLRYLGQVMLASGKHRHTEARDHFRQALELATQYQLAPLALDICRSVAQLLAQTEEIEQAVELLALVEQHEASTFETRKKARQFLAALTDQLPAEMAGAAQARGQTRDVWGATQDLLVEFLSPDLID